MDFGEGGYKGVIIGSFSVNGQQRNLSLCISAIELLETSQKPAPLLSVSRTLAMVQWLTGSAVSGLVFAGYSFMRYSQDHSVYFNLLALHLSFY